MALSIHIRKVMLVAALLPAAANAEFDWDRAEDIPIVLTPARLSQPLSEVPASVTMIDRRMIEASGAREIADVLRLVPGMVVFRADGNVPTVSYHATQARDIRRMQVMIDGRSVYQPGLARVHWNSLPVAIEDIERIEVTRGPNAASYGANSFSAIINIVTRHARDVTGTEVSIRSGNNGVRDARFTQGIQGDDFAIRLTVNTQQDNGYDYKGLTFDLPNVVYVENRDHKYRESLNVRTSFEVTDSDEIEWSFGVSRDTLERAADGGFQNFLEYRSFPEDLTEKAFMQLNWHHDFNPAHQLSLKSYAQYHDSGEKFDTCFISPISGQTDASAGLWFSRELRELYERNNRDVDATFDAFATDPAVVSRFMTLMTYPAAGPLCGGLHFDIQEHRYDIELQDTLHINDQIRLVTGLGARHDRIESEAYLDGTEENFSRRAFTSLEVRVVEPLLINLGGFWEADHLNGKFFSPRAAAIFKLHPHHSIRMVYSEALRTLDIYEAKANVQVRLDNATAPYSEDPYGTLGWGNPAFFMTQRPSYTLDPERIRSREIGYFGSFASLELDIRFFEENLRDLISEPINLFSFNATNMTRADITGWETQLSWRPHHAHLLRVTGSNIQTRTFEENTLQHSRIEDRLTPEHVGSFLWSVQAGQGWRFSSAYYLAHSVDKKDWFRMIHRAKRDYERAEVHLSKRFVLPHAELDLGAFVQRDIVEDGEVFNENRYADRDRFWLSALLRL